MVSLPLLPRPSRALAAALQVRQGISATKRHVTTVLSDLINVETVITMPLILEVIRYQNHPPEQNLVLNVDQTPCSIGRAADNDLVLADPKRVLSKKHASIRYDRENYLLADTSSNGTFVNHAAEAVGRGNEVILRNGDTITLGPYECQVRIEVTDRPMAIPSSLPESNLSSSAALEQPSAPAPELPRAPDAGLPAPPYASAPTPEQTPAHPILPPLPAGADSLEHLSPSPAVKGQIQPSDHVPLEDQYINVPQAIPEDWDSMEEEAVREPSPLPRAKSAAPPPKTPVAPVAPPESITPPTPLSDQQAIKAFLNGVGQPQATIAPERAAAFMEEAGRLFREMTQSMKTVLDARTTLKGEFRLEMTTIRPVENNPLKFSTDVDDAINKLLFPPAKGYLPPLAAVQEAADDLQAHQMAMLAGLSAALKSLVARFEPEALAKGFTERGMIDNLPWAKEARHWQLFKEVYHELAEDAENDFLHYLGEEFARAYEEQIARLNSARLAPPPSR